MAIPNISSLLIERERRTLFQYSSARAQHGISTYNNLHLVPANMITGRETEGFIFGRDVWGIGKFGNQTSQLGAKYGIT